MKKNIFTLFLFLTTVSAAIGQPVDLRTTITNISHTIDGKVGVSIVDLQTGDTLSVNGHQHFPMQSVFKFHIALAALRKVDEGRLSLDQKYHITRDHYFQTWSVLMRSYPDANVDVTLRDLITWSVMNSDNVAADMLFEILGGPQVVDEFIKGIGIPDIAITNTERKMHTDWLIQFDNWTTPNATAQLLKLFDEGKILTQASNKFLWGLMTQTPNASKRLKGLLPENTVVARKPGTSGKNADGLLGAVNDVGIMVLPTGRKVIVAAYISNTKEPLTTAEEVIARISKAVYDHYLN